MDNMEDLKEDIKYIENINETKKNELKNANKCC